MTSSDIPPQQSLELKPKSEEQQRELPEASQKKIRLPGWLLAILLLERGQRIVVTGGDGLADSAVVKVVNE